MTNRNIIRALAAAAALLSAAGAAADDYDLKAYLALVEQKNVQLRIARNGLSAADADIAMARSALLPSVAAQGGYTRNLKDTEQSTAVAADLNSAAGGYAPFAYRDVDSNYDNELTLALSVNQKIFDPAALASYAKAKKGRDAVAATYDATRNGVFNGAKKTYAQAQLLLMVQEVREAAERTAEQTYRNAQRRFEVGSSSELDLLNAESAWKSSIPAAAEARRNAEIALVSLKNLAGIPLDEPVRLTETHAALPGLPEARDTAAVLAVRPDYAALGIAKDLADIAKKAALASFAPTVSGSFTYAAGQYRGYESAGDTTDFSTMKAGLTVTVPLFSGGYRLALNKAAALAQEKAGMNLELKRNDIEQELRNLRLTMEESFARIDSAKAAEATARRAAELSQTIYEAGGGTQLAVSDAQDRYRSAQIGLYNAVFGYLAAYYDWELATGAAIR